MTGKEFADLVHFNTRTNDSLLPPETLVNIANNKMVYLAKKIDGVDEDYFGSPETRDLVDSSITREYPLPSDTMSRFKKVEAKFDGNKWIVIEEIDTNDYEYTTDEATITSHFANEYKRCFHDIFRNSLWIYSGPITPVVGGLKIWTFAYPMKLEVADLLDNVRKLSDPKGDYDTGIPELFHELWADLVSIHYKSQKDKPIPLTEQERSWQVRLHDLLIEMKPVNRGRKIVAGSPDTSEWGDHGYNY